MKTQASTRPLVVAIVCFAWFILGPFLAASGIRDGLARVAQAGAQRDLVGIGLLLSGLLFGLGVVAMLAVWQMRRMGLYAMALLLIPSQLIPFWLGQWRPGSLVMWLAAVVVAAVYVRRMR